MIAHVAGELQWRGRPITIDDANALIAVWVVEYTSAFRARAPHERRAHWIDLIMTAQQAKAELHAFMRASA
jgi:hypothetical protein